MDIAVVIPTYNRAHLIGATLDSILAQSHAAKEIVVVDDGSTDHTESVIAKYAGRIQYTRIENSGPCVARNLGVDATTSPWIAFCDSDDLWQPAKLELQAELCARATDVEYCFTNFRAVTDEAWCSQSKFDSLPADYWKLARRDLTPHMFVLEQSLIRSLLSQRPVFPSTVLMKRSFFESVGRWDEALGRTIGEDAEFLFRCTAHPPIGVVTLPLAGIRRHEGNWTANGYKAIVDFIEILKYVLKHHPAAQEYGQQIQEQIEEQSARAAAGAFAAGDFETMKRLLAAVPTQRKTWKLQAGGWIVSGPRPLARMLSSLYSSMVGQGSGHFRSSATHTSA